MSVLEIRTALALLLAGQHIQNRQWLVEDVAVKERSFGQDHSSVESDNTCLCFIPR